MGEPATGECTPGEARLPKDLIIGPEHLVASFRMLSVRLKTRRAVIERWTTARHRLKRIGIVRPRYHQVLRFNGKSIREPRPTRSTFALSPSRPFAVSSFTRRDVHSISHIGADIPVMAFDVL
jgi:hypothetical protein